MRKTNLAWLLVRRPDGIFVAPFERGEIGPDLFMTGHDFRVWWPTPARAMRCSSQFVMSLP